MMFEDLRADCLPGGVLEAMRPIGPAGLEEVYTRLANAPSGYVSFLSEIGAGRIGKISFNILPTPIPIEDIFENTGIEDVILFGDDFAGISYAFRENNLDIVEIDSSSSGVVDTKKNFEDFIREVIAAAKLDRLTI